MAKVRIVTDSSVYLEPDEISRLGITVIPIQVRLGRKTYLEGVDLTQAEFFRKMARLSSLPSIEPTSRQLFREQYIQLSRESDQILSIHLSAQLADVCAAAEAAAESLAGRARITVINSQSASFGLGVLVKAAAQAAAEGRTMDEIVRLVRGMIPHIYTLFVVESLEYLRQAGRIDVSQALLGTMFGIKPLVTLEEGELIPLEKVRSRARAVDKLYDFITEFASIQDMAIVQAGFTEETQELLERLNLIHPDWDFPVISYGPSLGVFLGPSAMGVIVYEGT